MSTANDSFKASIPLTRLPIASVLGSPCPDPVFVIPGLMPGMVGAISGDGGIGKTMFCMQAGVDLALGRAPLNGIFPAPLRPYRIAMICGEETALTCSLRLHAIVQNLAASKGPAEAELLRTTIVRHLEQSFLIYPASGIDIALLRRGTCTAMLDQLRRELESCDLTFIETVSRINSGDENSASDMAGLVNALEWLAQSTGCAVIATHHISKGAAFNDMSDSAGAARGSSAFVDNIRWLANMFPMSRDAARQRGIDETARKSFVRFEVTKANYCAPGAPQYLTRIDQGLLSWDPLAQTNGGHKIRKSAGARS